MNGQSNVVENGVKLVGEVILPGASQMLDGKIGSGLLHTAAAVGSTLLLGPLGGLLSIAVRLNSFSSSVNQRSLLQMANESVGAEARRTSSPGPTPASPGPTPATKGS